MNEFEFRLTVPPIVVDDYDMANDVSAKEVSTTALLLVLTVKISLFNDKLLLL